MVKLAAGGTGVKRGRSWANDPRLREVVTVGSPAARGCLHFLVLGGAGDWASKAGGCGGEVAGLRQEVVSQMANLKAELLKWMFLFWRATALTVIGWR